MRRYIIRKLAAIMLICLLVTIPLTTVNAEENDDISFNDLILNQKIKVWLKIGHLPSYTACIIKGDSVVWSNGYGFYTKYPKIAPDENTIYLIASISKTITTAALMQLWEDGEFDLDDDVNDYLDFNLRNPNYPEVNITFRMLLSHQSSLLDYEYFSLFFYGDHPYSYVQEFLCPDGSEYFPEIWGEYPPGQWTNYSNMAFIILGYLLERIAGKNIEDYCQENIFQPLGMNDTSFELEKLNQSRLATPYIRIGSGFIKLPQIDFKFSDPAGGLRTTINDLSKFLIVHMNNGSCGNVRILENSTVELIHTIQYPESNADSGLRYGLGWMFFSENMFGNYAGHNGIFPLFRSYMAMNLENDTGLIYFYNYDTSIRNNFPILNNLQIRLGLLARMRITSWIFLKMLNY